MITKQQRIENRISPEIQEFKQQCKTLQMATLSSGMPHVSYAPFTYNKAGFYILVSDVAQHGQNLKHSQNVSIMLIEDESNSKQLYTRRRLTFDTTAKLIAKNSTIGQQAILDLSQRFGDIIDNLAGLKDFNLYQLTPEKGRFVKGFGKAFDISGDDMIDIVHLNEGHVKANQDQ
ncbi:heme utilization protein HutZ [Moritella dasanensis]|uniref:heme utilization protein HutZ n=1 Tax=Moritella dasanensis TaxID=428031 RepID=UPI00031D5792|nr:heme utilization protein HutZ [Moritella dasanensis]